MKANLFFAAAMTLVMLSGCTGNKENTVQTSEAVTFDEVLATRRSVRSYDASKTISEAEVRELLVATQEAPSWANQQPSKQNIAGAPVLIVCTYEKGKSGFFQGQQTNEIGDGWGAYDNGLSNAYFILAARAKGYDTLIMGMRDSDELRKLFNIPAGEEVMAVISLGYRASEPNQPTHRPLDEIAQFS